MPARLTPRDGMFTAGSPVRYYLLVAPVTLGSTLAAAVAGRHDPRQRPALGIAAAAALTGAALTGHLVHTVNRRLLSGPPPPAAERDRLLRHWHRVNRVRIVLAGTALVALERAQRTTDEARPTGRVELPDGTVVFGRGRREPLPPAPLPQFGLYLGRRPDPRRRGWTPDWPAEWVDWPDFGIPHDRDRAAVAITEAYRRARDGERVEVACGGGNGRTGTVLACMAVLAGHPATDAVAWTRRHYRPRAVETPGQRRWVTWFAARAAT